MVKTIDGKRYLKQDKDWVNISTGEVLSKLPIEKWVKATKSQVNKAIGQYTATFEMTNMVISKEFLLGSDYIIKEVDGELRIHLGLDSTFVAYIGASNATFEEVGFEKLEENIYTKDNHIVDTSNDKITISKIGKKANNLKDLLSA